MNLNFLSLVFILNLFINLSNQIDFEDLKPFYCEEIDKNLNYFKNQDKFIFIIRNDIFNLIFQDQQFTFKNFYFGDYDEDEQSDELIVGHPYIGKGKNMYEFVGYHHNGTINNNNNFYLALRYGSESDCLKLENENGKVIEGNIDDCSEILKIPFLKIKGFNHYFNQKKTTFLLTYSTENKTLIITRNFGNIKNISKMDLKIDYEMKMAAISNVYSNDSKIDYFNLYDMDENYTIHINRIKTSVGNDNKIEEFKFEKTISLNISNFTNVIGCIDKITELNQIKGILFKDNKFYIISYRKYWIYESDLMKERFNLNYTNSSANYFKFINEDDLLTAEYEIRFSKWIKQLDDEIYFIPYKNSIFEIQFNNNENSTNNSILELKKSDKESLNYCKGSTIKFDNDDYCFESTKYFKIKLFKDNDNKTDYQIIKYSISDLFENTPYNYINDDKLLFIFKHTDNLYAFITIQSILLIDNKLFYKKEDYLQLKSPIDDNEFFFDENCLLRECVSVPKSRGIVYGRSLTKIFAILLIVVIIFVIYLIIKQNNKKTSNLENLKNKFDASPKINKTIDQSKSEKKNIGK